MFPGEVRADAIVGDSIQSRAILGNVCVHRCSIGFRTLDVVDVITAHINQRSRVNVYRQARNVIGVHIDERVT